MVSAVLVTRGNVDMEPVIDSLPQTWEIVIWDNGERMVTRSDGYAEVCSDMAVYGRYAAIAHATHDTIYVQDDDCIVTDAQKIVDTYLMWQGSNPLVCNMPLPFRHSFYEGHALVGFGAAFHRGAPVRAFQRFAEGAWDVEAPEIDGEQIHYAWEYGDHVNSHPYDQGVFLRTCDIAFTGLHQPLLPVCARYEDRDFASGPDRMWRQPTHVSERTMIRDLVLRVAGT